MKKHYSKPVVEKIVFDYKTQIMTTSPTSCFGSIINIATSYDQCGEGNKQYIGWNSENPGGI